MVEASRAAQSHAPAAVEWMVQHGMLTEQGHVVDPFITVQTRLSRPVLQGQCGSRISISKSLLESGWRAASAKLKPSIEKKVFNGAQALDYFQLLYRHLLAVQVYDQQYTLRHSQPKAYYEAMLAACTRADGPDTSFEVLGSPPRNLPGRTRPSLARTEQ